MKRSFIPPSHRPYVKGSNIGSESSQNEVPSVQELLDPKIRLRYLSDFLKSGSSNESLSIFVRNILERASG